VAKYFRWYGMCDVCVTCEMCGGMALRGGEDDVGDSGLLSWFVARGVGHSAANKFIQGYKCVDTSDAALVLRFELAPLHLANSDSVNGDMRRLLHCGSKVAKRVIQDLDVFRMHLPTARCPCNIYRCPAPCHGPPLIVRHKHACNCTLLRHVCTCRGEYCLIACTCMCTWQLLGSYMLPVCSTPTTVPSCAMLLHCSRSTVWQPCVHVDTAAHTARAQLGVQRRERGVRYPTLAGCTTAVAAPCHIACFSPLAGMHPSLEDCVVPLRFSDLASVTPMCVHRVSTPAWHLMTAISADAINMDTEEEATRLLEETQGIGYTPRIDSNSLRRIADARDGRPENDLEQSPRLHRRPSSMPGPVAEGDAHVRDPSFLDFVPSDSAAGEANVYITTESPSSARPPRMVAHTHTGHSHHRLGHAQAHVHAVAPSPPHSQARTPKSPSLMRKHAYARSLAPPSVDDRTISIDLLRSPGCEEHHAQSNSYALASHPTGSRPFDQGPYHRANSRLRVMLRHHTLRVFVATSWIRIVLATAAALAFCVYIGIRAWSLISGNSDKLDVQNVSVPYSWVVLTAEVALGFLVFYGHQTYWKQITKFNEMPAEEAQRMIDVCPASPPIPLLACPTQAPAW
jgi:hypothetical protein